MKTKVLVIGSVKFSKYLFKIINKIPCLEVVAVVTKKSSVINSDFYSLEEDAKIHNIPVFISNGAEDISVLKYIKKQKIKLGICIGWSHILSKSFINSFAQGIIGYHPSELPNNKGRHPLIWSLILGLPTIGSTFFLMNKYVDQGCILDQKIIKISKKDNATNLYMKVVKVASKQLYNLVPCYINRNIKLKKQSTVKGNSWRRRTEIDGMIDWRMSFDAIDNLVKALNKPYPGATCLFKNKTYIITKVEKSGINKINYEPGKVIKVSKRRIIVKCWQGSIILTEHNFDTLPIEGEYLF